MPEEEFVCVCVCVIVAKGKVQVERDTFLMTWKKEHVPKEGPI